MTKLGASVFFVVLLEKCFTGILTSYDSYEVYQDRESFAILTVCILRLN